MHLLAPASAPLRALAASPAATQGVLVDNDATWRHLDNDSDAGPPMEVGLMRTHTPSLALLDELPDLMQYETKYVLDALRAAALERFLDARLRPDPLHPAGVVHSVYYDTSGWRALEEKRASDYLKRKLRARWYADAETGTARGQVHMELKRRIGSAREKVRAVLSLGAAEAARLPLESLRWLRLLDELPAEARSEAGALFPAFELAYRRRRWVDPASGARVCLDNELRLVRSHGARGAPARPARASQAVFECKYGSRELPHSLGSLARFGCRKGSFSKYALCAEQLLARDVLPSPKSWRIAR